MIMHIVNSVGDSLDAATARAMTANLQQNTMLDASAARLIQAACSEQALAASAQGDSRHCARRHLQEHASCTRT